MGSNIGVKALWVVAALLHYSMAQPRRKNFDGIVFSNDVIIEHFAEITTPATFSKVLEYILKENKVPHDNKMYMVPSEIIDKTRHTLIINGYDPYFLSDLKLKVPSKSFKNARFNEVVFNGAKLFGMSNFRSIDDSKSSSDPFQLWFIWNNLRATSTVTVNNDGLKNIGEIDVRVGRLIMYVDVPSVGSKEPKIEMSKVTDLETNIIGLDMVSEDVRNAVILEVEPEMRHFLNTRVRNILLNYVRQNFEDSFSDNELSPLLASDFYEVQF